MSVGFNLLGEIAKPQSEPGNWLRRLERRILTECSKLQPSTRQGFVDEKLCLFCTFQPAAEEVEIALPDPKHVTVSANTSTVGPGYHIFLSDLIHRWAGELAIEWKRFGPDDDTIFGDETGYFFSGVQGSVYDHMESWLRTLSGNFFDGTLDADSKDIALCMPMNVQFQGDNLAITQLGPRDRDWLRQVSQGSIDYREFFPRYTVGLDADYYLGRALVHMWSDVRWRRAANDKEKLLIGSVLSSLDMAYRMNPELQFPWNEWNELFILSGKNVPDFVREQASGR